MIQKHKIIFKKNDQKTSSVHLKQTKCLKQDEHVSVMGIFYICYLMKTVSLSGLLKFCTVGFCGIGTLIDFILIAMQVSHKSCTGTSQLITIIIIIAMAENIPFTLNLVGLMCLFPGVRGQQAEDQTHPNCSKRSDGSEQRFRARCHFFSVVNSDACDEAFLCSISLCVCLCGVVVGAL